MVDGGKKRSRRAAAVHSLSAPDNYEDHALIRRQIEDFGVETTAELAKSSKERARIELLADMLADDGSEPAFFHSGLCMVSLPASKPADDHLPFERKNGKISLLINPTYISRPDGPPIPSGVPYGTRARLILLYLQTEAVRTRSPVVSMGDSLSDWMRSVGIESVSGGKRGTITQVYEQAKRIGYSTFTLTWGRGRRWVLRGPRQHPRGLLVAPAILAAAASRHLTGKAAALSRVFPVRSQYPQTRKGFARLLDRGAGCLSPPPSPRNPTRAYFLTRHPERLSAIGG
jgi:hypothetical protein